MTARQGHTSSAYGHLLRDKPKSENECKNPNCQNGQVMVRGRQTKPDFWEDGWFVEKCPLCLGTGKR